MPPYKDELLQEFLSSSEMGELERALRASKQEGKRNAGVQGAELPGTTEEYQGKLHTGKPAEKAGKVFGETTNERYNELVASLGGQINTLREKAEEEITPSEDEDPSFSRKKAIATGLASILPMLVGAAIGGRRGSAIGANVGADVVKDVTERAQKRELKELEMGNRRAANLERQAQALQMLKERTEASRLAQEERARLSEQLAALTTGRSLQVQDRIFDRTRFQEGERNSRLEVEETGKGARQQNALRSLEARQEDSQTWRDSNREDEQAWKDSRQEDSQTWRTEENQKTREFQGEQQEKRLSSQADLQAQRLQANKELAEAARLSRENEGRLNRAQREEHFSRKLEQAAKMHEEDYSLAMAKQSQAVEKAQAKGFKGYEAFGLEPLDPGLPPDLDAPSRRKVIETTTNTKIALDALRRMDAIAAAVTGGGVGVNLSSLSSEWDAAYGSYIGAQNKRNAAGATFTPDERHIYSLGLDHFTTIKGSLMQGAKGVELRGAIRSAGRSIQSEFSRTLSGYGLKVRTKKEARDGTTVR